MAATTSADRYRHVASAPLGLVEAAAEAMRRLTVAESRRGDVLGTLGLVVVGMRRAGARQPLPSGRLLARRHRVSRNTVALAVKVLQDPAVADLLGWEWLPRSPGQAWTVNLTGWDPDQHRRYLQLPVRVTTATEMVLWMCLALHAYRGRRITVSARQAWKQTLPYHHMSYRTWVRWCARAKHSRWLTQRRGRWWLTPERPRPDWTRTAMWAEHRRRARACGTPVATGRVAPIWRIPDPINRPRVSLPRNYARHHLKRGWKQLVDTSEDDSSKRRPGRGPPPTSEVEHLIAEVITACTHPPPDTLGLVDWLWRLPDAADATVRRNEHPNPRWPIRRPVRYCAALTRRFAGDDYGELSGANAAAAVGRLSNPRERHAWRQECQRLATAITTGRHVADAAVRWWKALARIAATPRPVTGLGQHTTPGDNPRDRRSPPPGHRPTLDTATLNAIFHEAAAQKAQPKREPPH